MCELRPPTCTWRSARRRFSKKAVGVTAAICATQSKVHFLQHVNANKQAVTSGTQGIVEFMDTVYLQRWFPELHGHSWLRPPGATGQPSSIGPLSSPRARALVLATTEVSCQPLSSIFDALGVSRVDLFILDAEGAEVDILRSIDFSRVRFNMLIVEALLAHRLTSSVICPKGHQPHAPAGRRGRPIRSHVPQAWAQHLVPPPQLLAILRLTCTSLPNGCGDGPQHPSQTGRRE